MSIMDQVAGDVAALYAADGVAVALTPPSGDPVQTRGFVNRRDMQFNPVTGARTYAPIVHVEVPMSAGLAGITKEWAVSTTDLSGQPVEGMATAAALDYGRGVVLITVKTAG